MNSDLTELQRLAGIVKQPAIIQSNPSYTSTELARIQRENNIRPGTPDWFRLWFAKPYLTGETPLDLSEDIQLNELFDQPYPYSQPIRTKDRRVYQFEGDGFMRYTVNVRNQQDPATNQKILGLGFEAEDIQSGERTIKRTNRHDTLKVFATLFDIASKELKRQQPDYFEFASAADDPGRIAFYRKMINRLIQSSPDYQVSGERKDVDPYGVPQQVFTASKKLSN